MGKIKEREALLTPSRMDRAIKELESLGFNVVSDSTCVYFNYQGEPIRYYVYTGWATGKTIKEGRGLRKLLKQLK